MTLARSVFPLIALTALSAVACKRSHNTSGHPTAGRSVYDTSPIDASALATSEAVRHHVLHMPFGEAAERLGSLHYEARSTMTISHGSDDFEQADRYVVSGDAEGNFHVILETPVSQLETYLVGEDVFVRYDRGHIRQKTRRDMDAEVLTDVAMAVLAQHLEAFGNVASLGDPHADHVEGRPTTRYRLRLHSAGNASTHPSQALPLVWRLPLRPPPRWQEQARPLDLNGFVSVDTATGVVLAADLDGRLEVPDQKAPPSEITVRLNVRVSQIGRAPAIHAPKAIAEFRRVARERDPISFFRDQIPLPKSDESKAENSP